MDKWWKTLDKAGDERGTRGDKRDLCRDCLRLFHTAGIMKGRNRWARAVYRPTGCERVHTLSRSPRAVLAGIWISNGAGLTVLVENSVSDETGVGRSAPLHPLGGRGARGLRPSRALPWGCTGGDLDFRRCRFDRSDGGFGFRRKGRGALCSPTPLGDGVREGCDPLALSRGAALAGI